MSIIKKNIVANYFGQFYSVVLGIAMVPMYLEYLGVEAYGLVSFFILLQSWMTLLDLGLSPTLSREVVILKATNTITKKNIFTNMFHSLELIFIIMSLIAAVIMWISSDWISQEWLNISSLNLQDVEYCISLIGIIIGLRFLTTLYMSGIIGYEAQLWLNAANIFINTLRYVGVLGVFYFIDSDIILFFEYQLIISIIGLSIFSYKFYHLIGIKRFKIYFSYKDVKPIIPFAVSIGYTSSLSVFATQLDKLLLSNILPLSEFGFFALVVLIANAIMMFSNPIGQAILPRMTNLIEENKITEMIRIYKQFTQFTAIVIFSIVGIVTLYSYELVYAWTGNREASLWVKDILRWYALGNGILAITAFTYYLQFAYGKMKLHVIYNTIQSLISIPIIIAVAYSYGSIGVAIVWFTFRLLSLIVWVPYIHRKFAPGINMAWMFEDILPVFISTFIYIGLLSYIDFTFNYSRGMIFGILILMGLCLLVLNTFVSTEGRKIILNFINGNKK